MLKATNLLSTSSTLVSTYTVCWSSPLLAPNVWTKKYQSVSNTNSRKRHTTISTLFPISNTRKEGEGESGGKGRGKGSGGIGGSNGGCIKSVLAMVGGVVVVGMEPVEV